MPEDNEPRGDIDDPRRAEAPPPEFIERVRAIISGIIVVGFVVTLLVVIFIQTQTAGMEGVPTIDGVASIYSGVTGAILGYYFGKGT
jgi:hypothetical protein